MPNYTEIMYLLVMGWFICPIIIGAILAYFINRSEAKKRRANQAYMDIAWSISRKNS
jgi:preprotein translocase subunit YajC